MRSRPSPRDLVGTAEAFPRRVGDHVAHGDFLGTCDFVNSGGLSRAIELRERRMKNPNATFDPSQIKDGLTPLNGPTTPDASRTIRHRAMPPTTSVFGIDR